MQNNNEIKDSKDSFDISNYWLYSEIRQIIILPDTLTLFIDLMNNLDCLTNENSLIDIINKLTESCYAFQSSQRSKILSLLIYKISSSMLESSKQVQVKTLITVVYCLMIVSYKDQNRFKSEINEMKDICHSLSENILEKITISSSTEDYLVNLYCFITLFIKQLSLWLVWNGFNDEKISSLVIRKKVKKSDNAITKLLYFLYTRFALPIEEVHIKSSHPIHHVLILGYYSFLTIEYLQNEFDVKKTTIKRKAAIENSNNSTKQCKLSKSEFSLDDCIKEVKEKKFNKIHSHLIALVSDLNDQREVKTEDLIKIYKMTPELIMISNKELRTGGSVSSEVFESIYINTIKLWTAGVKKKLMSQFEYNLYFWPLVFKDIRLKNFQLQVTTILDFLMQCQSKLLHDILSGPMWAMDVLVTSMEVIMANSTLDKNLTDAEKKEMIDLVGEVGKVVEVLLRPKNLKDLCRVVVVIPRQLFTFISELKSPLFPEMKRTVSKNVVSAVVTVLNKHTLEYMKMELRGAAREVCRDFLEIK